MKTYPWFKKYKTIFEQSNDYVSMCFLSSDVIDGIINKYNVSNHGFVSMHVTDEVQNLSLLFDMCVNSQSSMNNFFFIMRNLEKRLSQNNTFHELITRYNGL
jgi:hypothetical protein